MSTQRSEQSATTHAPIPIRGSRHIAKLTRVTAQIGTELRTLQFTFQGGTRRSARGNTNFIDPEHVPPFDGKEAWFEVEEYRGRPWNYWVALRQVEEPPPRSPVMHVQREAPLTNTDRVLASTKPEDFTIRDCQIAWFNVTVWCDGRRCKPRELVLMELHDWAEHKIVDLMNDGRFVCLACGGKAHTVSVTSRHREGRLLFWRRGVGHLPDA